MKILILTGKFGMGHWSASQSLSQQLLQAFPSAEVLVDDFFDYALPDASETIYKAFSLLVTRGSGLYNTYYKCTEHISQRGRGLFDGFFQDRLAERLAECCPDVVLATHPLCAQVVSDWKADTGSTLPLVTCITDLSSHSEWITPHSDCYFVGSEEIRDQLCSKGVDRAQISVTGIPVKLEFKLPVRRGGGPERHLLIMGGGLGLLPKKERFYQELDAMNHVRTTIIAGNNQKVYQRLHGQYAHIEVVGFTDRVYDYMAQADLMLSKPGGITLFETIFSELPILAWEPFLQQEMRNAHFITRTKIGRTAPKEPDACIAAIRQLIYDDAALAAMSQQMQVLKGQLEEESLTQVVKSLTQAKGVSL